MMIAEILIKGYILKKEEKIEAILKINLKYFFLMLSCFNKKDNSTLSNILINFKLQHEQKIQQQKRLSFIKIQKLTFC